MKFMAQFSSKVVIVYCQKNVNKYMYSSQQLLIKPGLHTDQYRQIRYDYMKNCTFSCTNKTQYGVNELYAASRGFCGT